jgi:hypothetical protein
MSGRSGRLRGDAAAAESLSRADGFVARELRGPVLHDGPVYAGTAAEQVMRIMRQLDARRREDLRTRIFNEFSKSSTAPAAAENPSTPDTT